MTAPEARQCSARYAAQLLPVGTVAVFDAHTGAPWDPRTETIRGRIVRRDPEQVTVTPVDGGHPRGVHVSRVRGPVRYLAGDVTR